MPLSVNLRHLARHNQVLKGELPAGELELDIHDEMIRANEPIQHELEAQLLDESLLVRGRLQLTLDCQCVRCLKPFKYRLELKDWACHLPLKGEDQVAVVDDSVDLTGPLREDILLAFPTHPVCDAGCVGLTGSVSGRKKTKAPSAAESNPSAWAELDKLKLRKN